MPIRPIRTCAAMLLAGSLATDLAAADIYSIDDPSMSVGINVQALLAGEFTIDDFDEDWDEGIRVEGDFRYNMALRGRAEPFAGAYVFYEDKEWDGNRGTSGFSYETLGLGVQGGATFFPFADFDADSVNVGLMPYARFGLGFQDADFAGAINAGGDVLAADDIDQVRWEVTVGADARLVVGRGFEAGAGLGWSYWNSGNVDAVVIDGSTATVNRSGSVDLDGNELFARVSLGFRF